MATKKRSPTPISNPSQPNKSEVLRIAETGGRAEDRICADTLADGLATAAFTALRFAKPDHGQLSLTEMVSAVRDHGTAVNAGDMAGLERMLVGQTVALNAIFGELARRAALNLGEHLPAAEIYLKLALKAQSQSRATAETLAAIKQGPVVIARQANINNGGQQQVNNGPTPARAEKSKNQHNKLLAEGADGGTYLDGSSTAAAGRADPRLAPVGAQHGANLARR